MSASGTSRPGRCASRGTTHSSRALFAFTLVIAGSAITSGSASAQSSASMAQKLAELRSAVETLSAELADKQQEQQDQLRSLARQKAELEVELQREKTRLQKIRASMVEKQKQIADEKSSGAELQPLIERNLAAVRAYVAGTLPFRTSERLAELDKIDEQLKSGLLTPQRAVMRVWTFVEDEFRLTRENGLYRQTVRLESGEQLADVIRIGMVALFFRTQDDRVGYAAREGNGWKYVELTGKEDRRRVFELVDSFKKQIRMGYFELPNALVSKAE